MSRPTPAFTYRLAFRPVDEQMSSSQLASTVLRSLLSLSGAAHGVSILSIQRPPQHDAQGVYVVAATSGPERWYLDQDDYLLSQGLRSELAS